MLGTSFLIGCGGGSGDETPRTTPTFYNATTAPMLNGTLSPSSQQIEAGETFTFAALPDDGYGLANISGCGGVLESLTYTTGAMTADCEINATFKVDSDADGVVDEQDAFPLDPSESVDTDGDGIGNHADTDDDNDGMEDETEIAQGSDPLTSNLVDLTYDLLEDFTEITANDNDIITDELFNQVSAKRSSYARFEWLSYLSDSANPEFIHYDADNGQAVFRDLDLQFRLENMACDSYQLAVSYMRSSVYYTRSLKIDRVEDDLVIQPYKGIGSVDAIKTENYDLTTLSGLSETIRIDGAQILLQQVGITASCQGFDSDLDGLVDTVEQVNNTDLFNSDTDGDGFSDSVEVGYGLNPLDNSDGPTADSDHDGISNGDEADNGLDPMNDLDGAEYDSDADGISNGDEIIRGLDPLDSEDALLDSDGDGVINRDDAFPYDPTEVLDTDGDRIGNNSDNDDDGDGVLDVDDAYPLDDSESVEFAQEHYFDAMQETQISMNIEAQELSTISADVIAVELFDKNNFPQFNLDDLIFTQAEDGLWTFSNNSAEPVSQLLISYNEGQFSLLEFTQQVAAFSQVSFITPTHTLNNVVYQNQMKIFLPTLIFDGGSDLCYDPFTDQTKVCYGNPNDNDRTIYEKHSVNMHNSFNMVAFDTFISDFYTENCAEYTGECEVTKLPLASENLLKMGAEKHNQGWRVMRHIYTGEGVGGGSSPNIVTYSSAGSGGWASIWEGYITPESGGYRGYGNATYKTGFHEVGHAFGFNHQSGMTYGMADAYPSFLNENVSEFEMEEMADKKVPQLFVAEQRNKDNKIQLNFYRLPDTSNSPVTIKLLSATEFSGRLALRSEQGNEVILFMDDQPTGTIYIRSANDDSKYYSTVKIAAEDFIE